MASEWTQSLTDVPPHGASRTLSCRPPASHCRTSPPAPAPHAHPIPLRRSVRSSPHTSPSLGGPARFKRGAWKLVGSCTASWNRRGTRHTDSLQTPSAKQTPRSLLKRPECSQRHDHPHARRRGSTSVLFLSPCRTCTHWVPRDRLSFVEEFTHLKARSHAMSQNQHGHRSCQSPCVIV